MTLCLQAFFFLAAYQVRNFLLQKAFQVTPLVHTGRVQSKLEEQFVEVQMGAGLAHRHHQEN